MKISKKYIGQEIRNIDNYSENTYGELVEELKSISRNWKKNGGEIIDQSCDELRVSDDNGENEILFQIID
jgi:hypothetical protein